MKFDLIWSRRARENLRGFSKREQQRIVDEICSQLLHNPDVETRNRKLMEPNDLATWELRIGDVRLFFDINTDAATVELVAIGKKSRNVLRIGGEEIQQ